jgi:hypothetical protein
MLGDKGDDAGGGEATGEQPAPGTGTRWSSEGCQTYLATAYVMP